MPPEFDSMIAKVIAHGRRPRRGARPAAPGAVADDRGRHRGGTTNKGFLLGLLDRAEVRSRRGRHRLARPPAARPARCCRAGHADVAARAGRDRRSRRADARSTAPASTRCARRGRPNADAARRAHDRAAPPGRQLPLSPSGGSAPSRYRVEVEGMRDRGRPSSALGRAREPAHDRRPPLPHRRRRCRAPTTWSRSTVCRTASRATTAASSAATGAGCRGRDPGAARRRGRRPATPVAVRRGDEDGESRHRAVDGRVRDVFVGRQRAGRRRAPLVRLEPVDRATAAEAARAHPTSPRSTPGRRRRPAAARRPRRLERSCSATTSMPPSARLLDDQDACATPRARRPGCSRASDALLEPSPTCACSSARTPTSRRRRRARAARRSTCSPSCARSTPSAEGLPAPLRRRSCTRALAHYGVGGLERGRARGRRSTASSSPSNARRPRSRRARRARPPPRAARDALERRGARRSAPCSTASIAATRAARAGVADLARSCATACFDEPVWSRAAAEVVRRRWPRDLASLAAEPAADRELTASTRWSTCPQPLAPLLRARLATAPARRRRCSR